MKVVIAIGDNAGTYYLDFHRKYRRDHTILTSCTVKKVDPGFPAGAGMFLSEEELEEKRYSRILHGTVRNHPLDKFDKNIGRLKSLARALKSASKPLLIREGETENGATFQEFDTTITETIFSRMDRLEFFDQYDEHLFKSREAGRHGKKIHQSKEMVI